ncbi:flagellar hook-length control protein FliK [Treponema phagedenis]|uniref:Flagellar hook-length control protein n=1 Tax=Treponema phagedenis TaxID=162 RepID=A0A0B7H268_TREPH|nr:flagellar hook-length control protein FliK [Treponema phagedenis]NVP24113.1 flagellar hook-length control protein FliK [Treponema phagedenis]QKS93408.1 flagellar hook-length control protein FliK [Treponema phagedenis]QLC59633.1 flagellar hook-length control protein FliK [Treponema phagedenis]QSI00277.1 flagellar hook-length control protein FliK [Treponema phagedenis]CEM63340.1 Flagellar hook-length control protein [Treponema phagedenis]
MQTLGIGAEILPLANTGDAELKEPSKKEAAEPVRKGDSFPAMLKKMIAKAMEGENPQEKQTLAADFHIHKETGTDNGRDVIENKKLASILKKDEKVLNFQKKDDKKGTFAFVDSKKNEPDVKNAKDKQISPKKSSIKQNKNLNLYVGKAEEFNIEKLQETIEINEPVLLFSSQKEVEEKLESSGKGKKKNKTNSATVVAEAAAKQDSLLAKLDSKLQKEEETAAVQKQSARTKKLVFDVQDLRTGEAEQGTIHEAGSEVRVSTETAPDATLEFRADSTVEGAAQNKQGVADAKPAQPQNVQSAFLQQIQSASTDIVQSGKIILRDNNQGLIRINLKPEHLGTVKINLELSGDKKLTGRISVASKEAYEAFKESLHDLTVAFEQGGFETAGFDLQWFGESNAKAFSDENMFHSLSAYESNSGLKSGNEFTEKQIYSYGQAEAVNILA